jgi:amphi-Trp domain-containing protein
MASTREDPSVDEVDVSVDDDDEEEHTGARAKDKDKAKIKFASVMQRGEAVAYFSALVDGLRHGRLQFRHGVDSVALEPSEQVAIEVKAARKGEKERLSFELEWKRPPREQLEVG